MKKLACVVLSLIVCLCMGACGSKEIDTNKDKENNKINSTVANKDYFVWDEFNTTVIKGYTEEGLKQTELVVPKECTSVHSLGSNTTVKHIKFENSDTELLSNAFRDCTALETIELPQNIKLIDSALFTGCSSLKEVSIPDTVTEIKHNAFKGCTSLKKVVLGDNIESIGRRAFYMCESLESMVIPDKITTIYDATFGGCSSLKTVQMGASITVIEEAAFQDCKSVEEFKLPNSVTTVGSYAFAHCDMLKDIYLPESITSIEISSIVQAHNVKVHIIKGSYVDDQIDGFIGAKFYEKIYE